MESETLRKKLSNIEKEIQLIKLLVLFRSDYIAKPRLISFRGMAKLLVSEEELMKSIEEAKVLLFKSRL